MAQETISAQTGPASTSPLRLVNDDPRYQHAHLIDPSPAGFVYLAVQTGPKRRPGPVRGRDEYRDEVVARLAAYATDVARSGRAREASVFRAVLLSPAPPRDGIHPVQPDTALLVETATPDEARAVADTPEFDALLGPLQSVGGRVHVLVARNVRRIADVEHIHGRLFLFNHFFADDETVAVELWERLAAWYEQETSLRDSMLLAPIEGRDSAFALVNHASFDGSLPRLFREQFAKRSFFNYVLANLRANGVVAMPALHRLVLATRGSPTESSG